MSDREWLKYTLEWIKRELSWMPDELPGEDMEHPSPEAISAIRWVRLVSIENIVDIIGDEIKEEDTPDEE